MIEDFPETLEDLEQQEAAEEQDEPQLQYNSVFEFYEGMIAPLLRDRLIRSQHQRWSSRWWTYPEAMLRLDALWRAYESLRQDPATGISVWLRDHYDHHMAILTSEDGPFGDSRDQAKRGEYPPYDQPPEEVVETID